MALVRIFILAEVLGKWPDLIGIVLICLLPKLDGGRRPIGLLPSMVRLWMRIRFNVVRSWEAAHDRPFFYAGPRKGAKVAAWKQAARAELARVMEHVSYASMLLDLVKAFERAPHEWLVRQAVKYQYPLLILRLSIAAYKLGRTIVVDGVCTAIIWANRGITAGSVHATIELRVLLIQWLDETVAKFRLVTMSVYVDDTGIEAAGPALAVKRSVIGATKHFTKSLEHIGMEFSHTKNVCLASTGQLAQDIAIEVPHLRVKVETRAKSLGGALGTGKQRNTKVLQQRLQAFKVRKVRFQKSRSCGEWSEPNGPIWY
jgi:hypothetical protein